MNTLDIQYQSLLRDILENGVKKSDRTGTGTISVFSRQIRHQMSEGFPLLTTKKMAWKPIVTELLWFLSGDTNIKWLLENGNTIWLGDAYKKYRSTPIESMQDGDLMIVSASHAAVDYYEMQDSTGELIDFVSKIKTDKRFAKKWGDLGPIYGKQWRSWSNKKLEDSGGGLFSPEELVDYPIDQITNLVNDLKTNPDSRRLMVNAWNAGDLEKMTLPPCHYGFQVYTRELTWEERENLCPIHLRGWADRKLANIPHEWNIPTRAISLIFNMRSSDVPLGLPFNIASYALLLEILGKFSNMIPEELIGNLGDTHIYLNQIDGVNEQLNRISYHLPTLTISKSIDFTNDINTVLSSFSVSDFTISNYKYHPKINIPLSN